MTDPVSENVQTFPNYLFFAASIELFSLAYLGRALSLIFTTLFPFAPINLTELKGLNLLFFLSIYSPLWIFNSPHHQRIRTSRCRKFRQKTDTKIVTFANTSTKKVLNMTDMFSNVKNIFNWLFQTRRIPIFMNVNFVMALIFFEEQDCCINTSINSIQVKFREIDLTKFFL